jgi:hypothetical protein
MEGNVKLPDEIPSSTLAALLDLTPQRIAQLVQAGVVPKTRHGYVKFPEAVHGYIVARVAGLEARRPGGDGADAFDRERWRKLKALNDRRENETIAIESASEFLVGLDACMQVGLASIPERFRGGDADRERLGCAVRDVVAATTQRATTAIECLRTGVPVHARFYR